VKLDEEIARLKKELANFKPEMEKKDALIE
jgi:uncharacterized small protein (DUF1192 family)